MKGFFARASGENVGDDGKIASIARESEHEHFLGLVTSAMAWMNDPLSESSNTMSSFDTKIDIFEGDRIFNELSRLGLTAKSVNQFLAELESIEEAFRKISKDSTQDFRQTKQPEDVELCLSQGSCRILGGFLSALKNIFDGGSENISAFRLVKYETMKYGKVEFDFLLLYAKLLQRKNWPKTRNGHGLLVS